MTDTHFLITVGDTRSTDGIAFITSFFEIREDMRVTLLLVVPGSSSAEPCLGEEWLAPDEKGAIVISSQQEKILEASRRSLCQSGIRREHIDTKIMAKVDSTGMAIIREGHHGNYDAVVLGSRGLSGLEKFLDGSVCDEMLAQVFDFPLWVCRNPEVGRKNVLLCLDGSDTAIRVADHVGYMLANQEEHSITLFHVEQGQTIDISDVFGEARERLVDNGVAEERIFTKTVKALRVGHAIQREAEEHKYAVVALGLLGRQHEGIKGWFMGTKSTELLKQLDKAVLWGCR
ncbi:MAG: universal stress protein [Proteobacteria bacterium]|nr:universal stress protein [Pseudomonadota bacterium]MBU1641659.1 universal stress protein [Pseudomonadota bacterium]